MLPNPSSIRQWSISISIALVAICVLIVTTILLIRALQGPEDKPSLPYANNVLSPPRPALSFELSNQHGATISLPSFESKPVLITLLYTQCAKACPITTGKLNQLKRLLDANDIGHSPPVFVIRNQEILLAMSNANFDPNLLLEYLRSLS